MTYNFLSELVGESPDLGITVVRRAHGRDTQVSLFDALAELAGKHESLHTLSRRGEVLLKLSVLLLQGVILVLEHLEARESLRFFPAEGVLSTKARHLFKVYMEFYFTNGTSKLILQSRANNNMMKTRN
jgi:hypothetical protein